MNNDPDCRRDGCGHPLSAHTLSQAEKRAEKKGTIVTDLPFRQPDPFNYHAGRSNSSCAESGCDCLGYLSPGA